MHILEPPSAEVSINLGGGEGNMPEKFLDGTQVGSAIEEMCGERVAHRMRRKRPGRSHCRQVAFEHAAYRISRVGTASHREEHEIR